jgi:Aminotransferase class I and II
VLLARALRPRHAVAVHPQFTEPEAALRAAGHQVDRVILPFPFTFDPALVPAGADLVFFGNPTNPTSVAHPREALLRRIRPGRVVVVDEAFADCLPEERESLASHGDLTGLVVIRSLTKTWGLAGFRVGYLLAAPVSFASWRPPRRYGRCPRRHWRRASPPRPRPRCARRASGPPGWRMNARTCSVAWTASRVYGSCPVPRRRSCSSTPGSRTCTPGCSGLASRSGEVRRFPVSARLDTRRRQGRGDLRPVHRGARRRTGFLIP